MICACADHSNSAVDMAALALLPPIAADGLNRVYFCRTNPATGLDVDPGAALVDAPAAGARAAVPAGLWHDAGFTGKGDQSNFLVLVHAPAHVVPGGPDAALILAPVRNHLQLMFHALHLVALGARQFPFPLPPIECRYFNSFDRILNRNYLDLSKPF